MTQQTWANPDVFDFYRAMPFNMTAGPEAMADELRHRNPVEEYPPLGKLLFPGRTVLEVGCGTGWMSNGIAAHCRCAVTGIDFNPVAIDFARRLAQDLGTSARFEAADLFTYRPAAPADVVISLGVLHHTDNCHEALRRVCREMVRPGGFLLVGLYHAGGRRPFLEHFAGLRAAGASDDELYGEFRTLFGAQRIDEAHLRSWFRDQVCHPHETQHTLADILPVLEDSGMTLAATSVNDYRPIRVLADVMAAEATLEATARERLAQRAYFPGFFTVLARRRS
ncbi:class I SAM-dependent methyltransferase [Azospirillum rugosum]|uniref:SAM-dependent methyltransferase n=1 Tax=Azospirillum rugosum TaxID=416170 RepID=A0ABS4SP19_9PROT|nr:class I SAM-dependent methyltransferase [Azospirillum rugosum]MBP2294311.1 SAM-dependent methyltransferase [Azospirillum rugosum]MDQ0527646.1 SAM-dependent methyltransferase [Azospirillum rugosum]